LRQRSGKSPEFSNAAEGGVLAGFQEIADQDLERGGAQHREIGDEGMDEFRKGPDSRRLEDKPFARELVSEVLGEGGCGDQQDAFGGPGTE
jgi:hypothetical protein